MKDGKVQFEGEYVDVDEIELPERSSDNLRHNDVELPAPGAYDGTASII